MQTLMEIKSLIISVYLRSGIEIIDEAVVYLVQIYEIGEAVAFLVQMYENDELVVMTNKRGLVALVLEVRREAVVRHMERKRGG
jgi:hypothetical protein